ncbi:hypothetical protein [Ideonella paludis]|uniref:hypothetical protein n=1 Tax=Ideonella paludis TaxID=1233411 RepID=UPI00363FF47C
MVAPASSSLHPPGLLVLHGNRLEWLADAVAQWLAAHPCRRWSQRSCWYPPTAWPSG